MAEVEVIRAADGPIARKRDIEGKGVRLDRIRVAAYVRVSTDGEEQLASFESQLKYYQEKIGANKDSNIVSGRTAHYTVHLPEISTESDFHLCY